RVYIGNSVTLISLSCSCLATIDQFFVTSRNANLRRFSNMKLTYRILLIISLISCLHGIPILLFYNISSITKTCINTNAGYAIYTPIYGTAVLCFIPVIIMIIFGYLTYYNINSIRILTEQQADRQLIRMILSQAISAFITFMPYGINIAYSQITLNISKDPYRLNIESFISMMTTLLSYIYYAANCYIFLMSSSRFRRTMKLRILFCFQPNQVDPFQLGVIGTRTISKRTRNL
ncbi:unnamed protein product, partial [Adineta steineri]